MNLKKSIQILVLVAFLITINYYAFQSGDDSTQVRPEVITESNGYEEEYDEEEYKIKNATWTAAEALHHQKMLAKYAQTKSKNRAAGDFEQFGDLKGRWYNSMPKNMPGAFAFCEMLDGTDTIYGVSHNHYPAEYNSKSYIWKGTVYNPKSGADGDDFICINKQWPNRFSDLVAFKMGSQTRLMALVDNGPLYYTDNDGENWFKVPGLPNLISSVARNYQDGKIYATNGTVVYVSDDDGSSFSVLRTFGAGANATLYSPRYSTQPNSDQVYMARDGDFYHLNPSKTNFFLVGTYTTGAHTNTRFSIGGDSRRMYVTENGRYWVSLDEGSTWTQYFPKGNSYGVRTGKMNPGHFIAASPEDPNYVVGGYVLPTFSTDGLATTLSTTAGWGDYQNGNNLSKEDYLDRIRFNYHPDFQAHQFFYNSTNDLFYVGSTDGGLYMSYKVWLTPPCDNCGRYDVNGYNSDFINITTLSVPSAQIYRGSSLTGYKDPRHIIYGTQDQGSQEFMPSSSELLDTLYVHQRIAGDGAQYTSHDGNWVWRWNREGEVVIIPEELYDNNGNRRTIAQIRNLINNNQSATFTKSTNLSWLRVYIDRAAPAERLWVLAKRLDRATVVGNQMEGYSVFRGGSNQIAAFTQCFNTPDTVFFLKEGLVFKSTNRGQSFDQGTATPFTKTTNTQNIGSGWVLPTDDNWILFAGPSQNSTGAILSKDGGATWQDITGDFPSGSDFQVTGLEGTPDGKYVFAGTDIGPWVFNVAEEKWYPLFGGEAGMFNCTALQYVPREGIMRFSTWGRGIMDFIVDDNQPKILVANVQSEYNSCDSLVVNWSSNFDENGLVQIVQNGNVVNEQFISSTQKGRAAFFLSTSEYSVANDYTIIVSSGNVSVTSNQFAISTASALYNQMDIAIDEVSHELPASMAVNVLDGDISTYWHSSWDAVNNPHPHEIVFKTNTKERFLGFSYLIRQGSFNGRINQFEVYGSANDKQSWQLLKSGNFQNTEDLQIIDFDQIISCDYIKIVSKSAFENSSHSAMAEFNLYAEVQCDTPATDCNNEEGGSAAIDNCGVCSGGSTGIVANESCVAECGDQILVFASLNEGENVGSNTLDGDFSTRWFAQGFDQYLIYKFPCPRLVSNLQVAFHNGDTRTASFDVQVSSDSLFWENVGSFTSSGQTLDLEQYAINSDAIYYLKIINRGNSNNNWIAVTEVDFEFSLQNDCYGDFGGLAFEDSCGICANGNTGEIAITDPLECIITTTQNLEKGYKVFPSLLNRGGTLNIEGEISETRIYNAQGKEVYSSRNKTKQSINTSSWSAGTYTIKILVDSKLITEKVIVI